MAVTNAITFLSYVSICLTLLYLARKTKASASREWAFFAVGFAMFIVACGSTHLMEVVTTWVPWFWTDAAVNAITAVLSAWIAVMLIRRAGPIQFGINDYARRLMDTEKEKRQLMESLLAAKKLEDWSRMSAAVTHEIANPLEAIQNLLYLIRCSDGVSEELVKLTQTASDEADRVLTISRSTLSFFRQGNQPEVIDLQAASEGVHFLIDTALHKRGIVFEQRATGDTKVEALPGEPRQVLLNLVRNAYEATTKPGATVSVTLAGGQDGVEVVVEDQGTGIDASVLPHLFQFGASTKGEQGNGMGLWAVKQIVTRHGGTIRAESQANLGTRFILWWPRRFRAQ